MIRKANLPLEGKAIRFTAGRGTEPAAWLWKVWNEGSEIYALSRNPMGTAKISVHASGQIHIRLGPKQKLDLAQLMRLEESQWFHAVELRFLLSDGAKTPRGELQELKKKSAFVVPVPNGYFLAANLIVGQPGSSLESPLPAQFSGGKQLWQTRLRDGRPAILMARMLQMDKENHDQIKYIRETLKPTVNFQRMPAESYVEIHHVHWSAGGNVVCVIPMGDESVRAEQDESAPIEGEADIRKFRYQSARCSASLIAPNGSQVAVLEFDEVDRQIELVKNLSSTHTVGSLKMRIEPGNLIAGSKFMASPCKLQCVPTIGGGSPRNWDFTVFARFDGFSLSAEIRAHSASIRNKNLAAPVVDMADEEELLMVIPLETIQIVASIDAPDSSAEVQGRFTLREVK